jgi:hypothetical protein
MGWPFFMLVAATNVLVVFSVLLASNLVTGSANTKESAS